MQHAVGSRRRARWGMARGRGSWLVREALGVLIGTGLVSWAMVGCASSPHADQPAAQTRADAADTVTAWMTGSFANTAQAQLMPDEFYDQFLHVVRIWPGRDDGPWVYVEQVLARRPDTPFRQRVQRLVGGAGGSVVVEIYALPNPLGFVGAWRSGDPLAGVSPSDLVPISGCDILLHPTAPGVYEGTTIGHGCASSRLGAAYASSAIRLTPDLFEVWDRGFDERGSQVWGSLTSGYVFDKLAD